MFTPRVFVNTSLKVGKLIIGHYSARYRQITPFLEEAKAIFPNTVGATDGAHFDI